MCRDAGQQRINGVLRGSLTRTLLVGLSFALLFGQIGLTLSGGNSVSAQSASPLPESASYAPADSLAFLSIDLNAESPQWTQATVLGERLGQNLDPQALVQSLLDSVIGTGAGFDASALLDGELAVVITDPNLVGVFPTVDLSSDTSASSLVEGIGEADSSAVSGVVLVAVVPSPMVVAAAINLLMSSRAESTGVELETTTYNNVTIASLPADPETGTPGLAAAVIDGAAIAATTPQDLEPIIDLRAGSGESLADLDAVSKVLAPLPADRLATGIVNGAALSAYATEEPDLAGTLAPVLSTINAVTGFTISAQSEGFQLDLRAASLDDTPVFGSNDNFDPTLIEQMPADTQVLIDGNDFGGIGILDTAVGILSNLFLGSLGGMFVPGDFGDEPVASPVPVATASPTLAEAADTAYSTLAFLLGFNLDTQLIGLLDGEFALGVWGIEGTDVSGASGAFISETSDPTTVSSSVGTLIGFLGFGLGDGVVVDTATVGDSTVNSIDVHSLGIPSPLTIGVVDGNLAIGVGAEGASAITGATDSLADDPLFIAATAGLPSERNALIYLNVGLLRPTIDASLSSTVYGEDGSIDFNADALAIAGFQDGDMAGAQGLLYIPAN
jgi:hypothetical protein